MTPGGMPATQETFFVGKVKEEADRLVARYETKRAALLPILHFVQRHKGCIPRELEEEISGLLEIYPVDVREVVTFYTLFYRKPVGRTHLAICRTTACWLLGAQEILDHVREKLGTEEYEPTADGKFSYCAVECLGACEMAPMVQVNGRFVGPVAKKDLDDLLAKHGH